MIQARTKTLVKDYEYISRYDSALDFSDKEFDEKWTQYIDGKGEPPLKPKAKPTVFTLKHLIGASRALLEKEVKTFRADARDHLNAGAFIAAFRLAVVGVENFSVDGKEYELTFDEVSGVKVLSEESTLCFPDNIVMDVGFRSQTRTYLDPK